MESISLAAAFTAGLFSFISPCVLPLIPAYISFVSGLSIEQLQGQEQAGGRKMRRVMLYTLVFVLGFSTVFVLMGASATYLSKALIANRVWFGRVAGVLIGVLGLHMTGIFRLGFLEFEKKIHIQRNPLGIFGVYLIGAAFAFGWTPCIGPILASILALAGTQETVSAGVVLLSVYSLGLGLPFLVTGAAINGFMGMYKRLRKHLRKIEIFAGIFLILVGLLIFFDMFSILNSYIFRLFPGLSGIG